MDPLIKYPLLIFGSRHGSIYNLTPSNLIKLPGISLSVGDFYDCKETISNLPQNLRFSEDIVTYLTPYDFYKEECLAGSQDSKLVKIKCSKGYTAFDADMYDQFVKLLKPNYAVVLTQYPTLQKSHKSQSNKSHKRAILKTKTYFQKSKFLQVKENYPDIKLLGAIHGGKNQALLARSLSDNINPYVNGLVICDLCDGQTIAERQQIFKVINERLSQQQRKFQLCLAGIGKIEDIKHAMKFGYSIFEVNYPFILASEQKALIFNQMQDTYSEKIPQKVQQLKPLSESCKCYTCQNHSQSYIAHLIDCHEMTGKVLLSIHNLQIYNQFIISMKSENNM